ncbi:MAG: hypothetical protein ACRD0W_05595 [Acidimicrobiales bacterium]
MSFSDELSNETLRSPSKSRRRPSTGFPVVPLPEAARVIREAGKYGFEHSVSAFARYMGHSTTNSGAFRQRLAAFRDWKLIAGRGDTVVFTDTAKTISLPPDATAERDALQTAFMNCDVFAKLYDRVAKGQLVQAQHLGAKAVHELGISPGAVERFAASFVESAVAAGLAEETDNGQVVLLEPGTEDETADPGEADDGESRRTATQAVAGRVRLAPGPPVVHQEWTLPTGTVVLEVRLDRPLPAEVFAQVGAVVKEIEALADRLKELVADKAID